MTIPIITSRTDWTSENLQDIYAHIEDVGVNDLKLDIYPNQIEVISAEQMIDAYASVGMPVNYSHWSFGKRFLKDWGRYQKGQMGLAYEIVINSNPCISYLMEENNAVTQTLVMAHAAIGHNFVFKNNYMLKEVGAGSIIDYMIFAKNFIRECEKNYGEELVEDILDAAHSLSVHGIDKTKRKHKRKLNQDETDAENLKKSNDEQKNLDIIIKTTSIVQDEVYEDDLDLDLVGDEENILYFIYKNAPNMPQWQREILRIVYKIAQYFYPQGQCITGEHLISTNNGLLRLDELIADEGYLSVNNISLLTLNNKFTEISHTYLKKSQKVVKVTTKTGRTYIGTPEHKLMTLDGQKQSVKALSNMTDSDYIVLNLDYDNAFAKEYISLKPLQLDSSVQCDMCGFKSSYLPSHIKDTHGMQISDYANELSSMQHRANKSANYPSKFPEILNENMGEFLGYLDKCTLPSEKYSVYSFSGKFEILNRVKTLLNDLFGIDIEINEGILSFSSWGLRQFLELNFASNKTGINKCIRTSPVNVIKFYIRALIDRNSVRRTSISNFELFDYDSEKLEHLQSILGAMGIISVLSSHEYSTVGNLLSNIFGEEYDGKNCYEIKSLKITAEYAALFADKIGSVQSLPESIYTKHNGIYSNFIPGALSLLKDIRNIVKNEKKMHSKSIKSGASYKFKVENKLLFKDTGLLGILDLPEPRSNEISVQDVLRDENRFNNACNVNCDSSRKLKMLIDNSIGCYYDKVASIEELNETRDVYDVTVPENHLFWVSGLISHNTKVLNEGMATFTHFYIMDELEKKGLISDDAQLAWLHLHSNVIYQPNMKSPKGHYDGTFNPYALGFSILKDVRRICENPTAEDREWFPNLVETDWRQSIKTAVSDYRDESFIEQFLSPKLMRDMRMMTVNFADGQGFVSDISDERGYSNMRRNLALQHNPVIYRPDIVVKAAAMKNDRTLTLEYRPFNGRSLHRASAEKTIKNVKLLWGYGVDIVEYDPHDMDGDLLFSTD